MKARFTITTITTTDEKLVNKTKLVRAEGIKHAEIFERGLDVIIEEKGLAK